MNPPPAATADGRRSTDRNAFRIPDWAWPLAIAALMGIGAARVVVAGKEDATAHAADISDVRNDADKRAIRDSAWKADAMRILLDLQRRPNR